MKVLTRLVYAAMVVFIAIDFVMPRHHEEFFWDRIPGFSSAFGLASCVVLIVVSKTIGKFLLEKKEDYYDD
ncbi:MAG: hypothetical protein HY890_00315 [Deltaproteobacteria bacterium]|nr:hypothetical protein [Deltaproteobacteria bacterium]